MFAANGAASSDKTHIEDVFNTYLYTGNGSSQTINSGIDLAGKGGMAWVKSRSVSQNHTLFDTARGAGYYWESNTLTANLNQPGIGPTAFTSTGFSVGWLDQLNQNGTTFSSWTFRKAPKFFDVVTWTGNGVVGRTISHSLGQAPGMIIVKSTSSAFASMVYHRSLGSSYYLYLNQTNAQTTGSLVWGATAAGTEPTSTVFSVGDSGPVNGDGITYVAYLFAHDTTTDGLIQCGSYTGNATDVSVELGWEPQYLLIKKSTGVSNWQVFDNMRGLVVASASPSISPNLDAAEAGGFSVSPLSTGFRVQGAGTDVNSTGTFIYMAIRRGPMRTPTDATKVFKPVASSSSTGTSIITGFPIDMQFSKITSMSDSNLFMDRLRGISTTSASSAITLDSTNTDAEYTVFYSSRNWSSVGFEIPSRNGNSSYPTIYECFRRAPGFFDVVCYTGTGAAQNINHNLGVAPELVIIKKRSASDFWYAYVNVNGTAYVSTSNGYPFSLNTTNTAGAQTSSTYLNLVSKTTFNTSCTYIIGNYGSDSGSTYVAYLFASCPGVSKVGSYTGNGSSQTINCGFSAGARFVLIKRTDSTGDWYCWDTARGIVAATDPHLSLNTTAAEVTTDDTIDPDTSGFIVNQVAATNVNVTSATYIYLAIA